MEKAGDRECQMMLCMEMLTKVLLMKKGATPSTIKAQNLSFPTEIICTVAVIRKTESKKKNGVPCPRRHQEKDVSFSAKLKTEVNLSLLIIPVNHIGYMWLFNFWFGADAQR